MSIVKIFKAACYGILISAIYAFGPLLWQAGLTT
jgi:hypothetical protein